MRFKAVVDMIPPPEQPALHPDAWVSENLDGGSSTVSHVFLGISDHRHIGTIPFSTGLVGNKMAIYRLLMQRRDLFANPKNVSLNGWPDQFQWEIIDVHNNHLTGEVLADNVVVDRVIETIESGGPITMADLDAIRSVQREYTPQQIETIRSRTSGDVRNAFMAGPSGADTPGTGLAL